MKTEAVREIKLFVSKTLTLGQLVTFNGISSMIGTGSEIKETRVFIEES